MKKQINEEAISLFLTLKPGESVLLEKEDVKAWPLKTPIDQHFYFPKATAGKCTVKKLKNGEFLLIKL